MLLIVTGVGFLIHVYSIGYMEDDPGYWRFFAFLNFFVFAMTLLVAADNFLFLLVGWGGCRPGVVPADRLLVYAPLGGGRRAQSVRRQRHRRLRSDARHLPASSRRFGTLALQQPSSHRARCSAVSPTSVASVDATDYRHRAAAVRRGGGQVGAVAAACLAARRDGRPDAGQRADPRGDDGDGGRLSGGARAGHLLSASPTALAVVGIVGGATALFAATIACVQTDIKRVLAYSTMSQLGYMFMGEAAGGFSRRHLPPDDPRLLQGAALHGGGRGDSRAGGRAGYAQDGRAARRSCRRRSGCLWWVGWRWPRSSRFAGFWSKDGILSVVLERAQTGGGTGWYVLYARGAVYRRPDGLLHLPSDLRRLPRGVSRRRHRRLAHGSPCGRRGRGRSAGAMCTRSGRR